MLNRRGLSNKEAMVKMLERINEIVFLYSKEELDNILKDDVLLTSALIEVKYMNLETVPLGDYGDSGLYSYFTPSGKVLNNYFMAALETLEWLNESCDAETFKNYMLILTMTDEELKKYITMESNYA